MKRSDLFALVTLAALWGASYLFLHLGAGEFGAVPLAAMRAAVAAVVLVTVLLVRGEGRQLGSHWRAVGLVGVLNSAVPFVLFAYAAQHLPAGLMSILTAMTPLFTLAIAAAWLRERLQLHRLVGFGLGLAGVAWIVAGERGGPGEGGVPALAVGACLLATLLYGISSNFAKHRLAGVPPLAVAAGSQIAAALVLAVPAAARCPATVPSAAAWGSLLSLAVGSTAVAYVLFFRLVARVGAPRTMTVTFLIPAFGLLWGAIFLGERITAPMIAGCGVILAGVALATDLRPSFGGRRSGRAAVTSLEILATHK